MIYKIGNSDPTLWRDTGAGAWNSEPPTLEYRAKKALILNQMPHAAIFVGRNAAIFVGRNAATHLLHYFNNSGADLTIDLENMVANVGYAKALFESELKEAREFAQTLSPGAWQITSSKFSPGYNVPGESLDWFCAVGGYEAWGKGAVIIPEPGSASTFSMEFEYCFFDQYNWNKGIGIPLAGFRITDDSMGRFHREGLRKEFEMRGSYKVALEWKPGSVPVISAPGVKKPVLDWALGRGLWQNACL